MQKKKREVEREKRLKRNNMQGKEWSKQFLQLRKKVLDDFEMEKFLFLEVIKLQ